MKTIPLAILIVLVLGVADALKPFLSNDGVEASTAQLIEMLGLGVLIICLSIFLIYRRFKKNTDSGIEGVERKIGEPK